MFFGGIWIVTFLPGHISHVQLFLYPRNQCSTFFVSAPKFLALIKVKIVKTNRQSYKYAYKYAQNNKCLRK